MICLLGGSFNPPHFGHFRLVIEAFEALSPERVLFLPCAHPPHKRADNLLPFAFRSALLRAALEESGLGEAFGVCEVENERQAPSYTVETLAILRGRWPERRLAFIMGAEDYAKLPTWKDWRDLPAFADLVVLPRGDTGRESFLAASRALWPQARSVDAGLPRIADALLLPGGGRLLFLPHPLLAISSSLLRERWLQGRHLDFLLPKSVQAILREEERMVTLFWKRVF